MKGEQLTILAIETSAKTGSISLSRRSAKQVMWRKAVSLLRSDEIPAKLDALLVETGVARHEIDRIVVCSGPGSLTGIRNGRAFAKGLADALQIAVEEITFPDLLAKLNSNWSSFYVAFDIGRGQIITQHYSQLSRENSFITEHDRNCATYDVFQKFLHDLTGADEGMIVTEELAVNPVFSCTFEVLRKNSQLIVCSQPIAGLL